MALSTMAIVGTASAAAARDYPPTTGSVVTEGTAATSTVAARASKAAPASSGSLPFTGGNSMELVWIGAAFTGAGALAVARTRRNHRRA